MSARVLFIDHVGALGGAELVLLDLAHAYRASSSVLLLDDGPLRRRLEAGAVRVAVLEGGRRLHAIRRETRWPSIGAGARVATLAAKVAGIARRYDCIYANSQKAFVVSSLAGLLSARPVIWGLHDLLTPEHFSGANIRLAVTLANRRAARVVANSEASADAFVARGGRRDKVRVVYNGLPAAAFDGVTDRDLAAARQELGLGNAPIVVLAGRLARWKGQHIAIDALANVPGAHLLIIGEALFGEEEYEASVRAQVARLGLAPRVHFLGFRLDIPRLMRLASVILHTSTAPEPFGRVIVEGMLAGQPVVATRGGAVEELLDHGVTGIVVPPGDPSALASAIRSLLDDRERAALIAGAGRKRAEERFTVEAMVAGVGRVVDDVVAGARPRARSVLRAS